jgi:RHS repeat-associated protein
MVSPSPGPGVSPPVTQFLYDTEANLIGVVCPNGERIDYEYDADRRLSRVSYPDGRVVHLEHDRGFNVVSRRNSDGSKVNYKYDAADRLIRKVVTNTDGTSAITTYEYDADGRVVSAENENHSCESEYDAVGRSIREVQDGREFRYEYDRQNRRTKMIYPDGTTVRYVYDDVHRTTTIDSDLHGKIVWSMDSVFRPTEIVFDTGVREKLTYETDARPIAQMLLRDGQALRNRTYRKDHPLNLTEETIADGGDRRFVIGGTDRVLTEERSSVPGRPVREHYAFDSMDNITMSPLGGDWQYGPGNRLLRAPGRLFQYDGRGNMSAVESGAGTLNLEYDAEGQLLSAKTADGKLIEFSYDPFFRRTTKTVNGAITHFWWDMVVPAVESSGKRTVAFLFQPEGLVPVSQADVTSRKAAQRRYYYHVDSAGAVRDVTDAAGKIVWSADYSPLGKAKIAKGSTADIPFRTIGEYWDDEIELGYHRTRYYDADTGRFASPDPGDVANGFNLYIFQRNALNFFDPFGFMNWGFASSYGSAFETFCGNGLAGATGPATVSFPNGTSRVYDNFANGTYHEFKYIGQNGVSDSTLSRMRGQLTKDAKVLKQGGKVHWRFNRQPPASIRRRLQQLAKKYPGQFSWEVSGVPACQQGNFDALVKAELQARGLAA